MLTLITKNNMCHILSLDKTLKISIEIQNFNLVLLCGRILLDNAMEGKNSCRLYCVSLVFGPGTWNHDVLIQGTFSVISSRHKPRKAESIHHPHLLYWFFPPEIMLGNKLFMPHCLSLTELECLTGQIKMRHCRPGSIWKVNQ